MAKIIIFLLAFCLYAESTWVVFDLDEMALDPGLVQQAQQSAGAVFGLSARQPPVRAAMLKELAEIGINFIFSAPPRPVVEKNGQWEGGVFFVSDFKQKREIFLKWLKLSPLRPSNIIFIDQKNKDF